MQDEAKVKAEGKKPEQVEASSKAKPKIPSFVDDLPQYPNEPKYEWRLKEAARRTNGGACLGIQLSC